ncbi:DUF692 family protein [Nonomuraea phyllanthi]|uniref:DUF692 domain-containing protein n=1 Tax=Nonomuraea phyllanthi TaxID=2219224 RepID=UPI00129340A7|nr:DUF692 domain-containing protein [Nonomuraea phyllanthi]QFY12765.1 DUF692 family protein [Nonomuraea phyllanthi]
MPEQEAGRPAAPNGGPGAGPNGGSNGGPVGGPVGGPGGGSRGELGVGIGWRAELDLSIERMPGVDFLEVVAENVRPDHLPESLRLLRARGLPVIPHGVSLGVGGAEPPSPERLAHLASCAQALESPLVSEHLAFVRGGGLEAGHLLPVPRTRESLRVVTENVRRAQDALPVPLALENVAAIFGWPDDELTEAQFLAELVERTGVGLLVDVANLYTNQVNLGLPAVAALDALPLERLAYVHVAGGYEHAGIWHDTHTAFAPQEVLDLLTELCARATPPGVLLEWDDDYPSDAALESELARIRSAMSAARDLR